MILRKLLVCQALILIAAMFLFPALAQAQQSLREIIPYVTTREDVERKLGKPDQDGRYELKEGRVYINYRENACPAGRIDCFCLAPLGTVLNTSIQLYYDFYEKDLKLDPKKFKKSEVKGDVGGIFVYIDDIDGIVYEVQGEKVTAIRYSVSEKTCRMLTRKNQRK